MHFAKTNQGRICIVNVRAQSVVEQGLWEADTQFCENDDTHTDSVAKKAFVTLAFVIQCSDYMSGNIMLQPYMTLA